MRIRIVIDLLWIVVLYAIYWAFLYVAAAPDNQLLEKLEIFEPTLGSGVPMERTEFYDQFQTWAQLVMGLSLLATVCWYVIGQWGPKPHSTGWSTWLLIWLVGLAVVLAGGFTAYWIPLR